MKLISNTSFGEFCRSKRKEFKIPLDYYEWYNKVRDNYDDFLEQPLKLEMFVPCDEYGNFLEEPCDYKYWIKDDENGAYEGQNEYMCIKYQQAKEKVLFEGFEFNGKYVKYSEDWLYLDEEICEAETIEFLITYNINLTPNAIKEIGLTI